MTAKRMFLLQFGEECVPKSVSVLGADPGPRWEPVIGIAVETSIGWVVLDTGFSRQMLDDEPSWHAVYNGNKPRALDGEPFEAALAKVGIQLGDVVLAAVSHLHIDHSGGLPLLAKLKVPVVVQRIEHDFAMNEATLSHAYYRSDYANVGIDWRIIEGDGEIAPGISCLFTPGHTPGHMSYRVDLPETGTWLFAMDAADLAQNLFDPVAIGSCARMEDEVHALPSVLRLLSEAEKLDARLVPCHDPIVWKAVGNPRGGHR
jgi:N-acyl homoserine lactone hydrolase